VTTGHVVGYIPGYYEGDFTAVCAKDAAGYTDKGHAVTVKEAAEFSDQCAVCKIDLAEVTQ